MQVANFNYPPVPVPIPFHGRAGQPTRPFPAGHVTPTISATKHVGRLGDHTRRAPGDGEPLGCTSCYPPKTRGQIGGPQTASPWGQTSARNDHLESAATGRSTTRLGMVLPSIPIRGKIHLSKNEPSRRSQQKGNLTLVCRSKKLDGLASGSFQEATSFSQRSTRSQVHRETNAWRNALQAQTVPSGCYCVVRNQVCSIALPY